MDGQLIAFEIGFLAIGIWGIGWIVLHNLLPNLENINLTIDDWVIRAFFSLLAGVVFAIGLPLWIVIAIVYVIRKRSSPPA